MSNQGKQKRKKTTSPIRQDKLDEGQKILETMRYKTQPEQIFALFKERTTIESGFSIRELALLFFPTQTKEDPKTGHQIPTEEAKRAIYALLNTVRKEQGNNSMALYTEKVLKEENEERELYESIVYRMTTYRQFEPKKKLLIQVIGGLQESIEHTTEIVTRTPAELAERDAEFEKILQERRLHRSSKRKSGSVNEENR